MLDIVEECVMRGVEQAAAQMNFTLGKLARLVRSQIRRPCDRVRGRVSPVHIKLREYQRDSAPAFKFVALVMSTARLSACLRNRRVGPFALAATVGVNVS